jgi:hypothetical protein
MGFDRRKINDWLMGSSRVAGSAGAGNCGGLDCYIGADVSTLIASLVRRDRPRSLQRVSARRIGQISATPGSVMRSPRGLAIAHAVRAIARCSSNNLSLKHLRNSLFRNVGNLAANHRVCSVTGRRNHFEGLDSAKFPVLFPCWQGICVGDWLDSDCVPSQPVPSLRRVSVMWENLRHARHLAAPSTVSARIPAALRGAQKVILALSPQSPILDIRIL